MRKLFILAALSGGLMASAFADAPTPQCAGLSAKFTAWQRRMRESRLKSSPSGEVVRSPTGYVMTELPPDPIDFSYLHELQTAKSGPSRLPASMPSSYDLRDRGLVTSVKNQGAYGTCWAHAAIGMSESSLKRTTGTTYDLSENNLVHRFRHTYKPEKGRFNNGGHTFWAQASFLAWEGPLLESDDPYPDLNSSVIRPARKHLQKVFYVPGRTGYGDNAALKSALMNYGAFPIYFYWDGNCYNASKAAYYCSSQSGINHAVLLIGWDDSYSRTNFRNQPPGDGAFLIKNSWGSDWGSAGCCWISYYDTSVGGGSNMAQRLFASFEDAGNYDRVYQYDLLGQSNSVGFGSETGWGAAIFTATNDEEVAAVGFYANVPSTSYEIAVYRNCRDATPDSGERIGTASGTTDSTYAGYFTVNVPTTDAIEAGSKFSVVIKLVTPGYKYPLAYEYAIPEQTDAATAQAGETFISSSGTTWNDFVGWNKTASLCLKAYTKSSGGSRDETHPANDDLSQAVALTGMSGEVTGSNAGATQESGEPAHVLSSAINSVWWTWTAPADGTVTFSTQGSGFDTAMAVYTGSSVSELSQKSANDDAESSVRWSKVSLRVARGTAYLIAVAGYRQASGVIRLSWSLSADTGVWLSSIGISGAGEVRSGGSAAYSCTASYSDGTTRKVTPTWRIGGNQSGVSVSSAGVLTVGSVTEDFSVVLDATYAESGVSRSATKVILICVRAERPSNDDFANAKALSGASGSVTGSNLNATHETGEGYHGRRAETNSVWYAWTAPSSGDYSFTTEGSSFDTGLAVYAGKALASLVKVAENDDANVREYVTWSSITFTAVAGTAYRIAVAGYRGASGSLKLNWSRVSSNDQIGHFVVEDGVLVSWDEMDSTDVVIPADAGITEIGEKAFYVNRLITSVTIPKGVKKIGNQAFGICHNLTNVVLNSDLEEIGYLAFCFDSDLVGRLYIPASVKTIGFNAFWETGYSSVVFLGTPSNLGNEVFNGCEVLTNVYFKGNAPTTLGESYSRDMPQLYLGTCADLTTWVKYGSTGWQGAGSTTLPSVWPSGDGEAARAIVNYWPTYAVILNKNDGSGTTRTLLCELAESQALPWLDSGLKWTRSGCTFKGWARSPSEAPVFANGQKVLDVADPGEAVTLYAIWQQPTYAVRFNKNDGSGTTATQTFTCGVAQCLKWKDSQLKWTNPSGRTFLGWSKSSTATTATYANGQSVKDLASAGATLNLYAVWKTSNSASSTYTVRFNKNDGSGTTATQTFTCGVAQCLKWKDSQLKWSRAGYTFLGWAIDGSGLVKYANGEKVKDLAAKDATKQLYAVWGNAYSYTVVFHRNYNSSDTTVARQRIWRSVSTSLVWKDSCLGWTNPSGSTFLGWSLTANGSAKYANGAKVNNLSAGGTTIHLYACWGVQSAATYVVRFNKNDGSGVTATQTFKVGVAQSLKWKDSQLKWTNPNGKIFLGWMTDGGGFYANGQSVRDIASAGQTVNLYAIWSVSAKSSAVAVGVRALSVTASTPTPLTYTFNPGLYYGTFADGSGTFDLLVDEFDADGVATAYLVATTEDGTWSEECEATAVGETLVLSLDSAGTMTVVSDGENLKILW